ncbi:hypothetical protein R3P38DRAFT_3291939 [Favolaschia claudopus]|uniref:F-box domain-containing protein n=1 Tax=Favolaschia claudopus TaxID=2862362 RepID=A0AAV9ZM96_9AGAR
MHQPQPAVRYLAPLPVEIWTLCWSLCSLRQQRRLSLVCTLFRSITLPFLFKHLSFDVGADFFDFYRNREEGIRCLRHMHRIAVRLDKLTEAPLAFAPFVQSWTVALGYRGQSKIDNTGRAEDLHTRIFETFGKALTLCHHLSMIHLKRLRIDTMLLSMVLSLPKLQHLTLDTRELTIADTGGVLPKNSMLRSLDLSHDFLLREGFADIDLPLLAHLTVRCVKEQEAFFQHVERFSQLESLTIDSIESSAFPVFKVNSLPNLRALSGPSNMITALAPNRPITRAFIDSGSLESLSQTCVALSRSVVPVYTLGLPYVDFRSRLLAGQSNLHRINSMQEFLTEITTLLPDVTDLTLKLPNPHMGRRSGNGYGGSIDIDLRPLDVEDLPILCDDTAFNDLPEHEISDDEGDSSNLGTKIIISVNKSLDTELKVESWTHQSFLKQISPSSLPLPRNIEVVHLQASWVDTPLPLAAQERALESLITAYPTLREVQFALPNSTWRQTGRSGSFWRVVSNDC